MGELGKGCWKGSPLAWPLCWPLARSKIGGGGGGGGWRKGELRSFYTLITPSLVFVFGCMSVYSCQRWAAFRPLAAVVVALAQVCCWDLQCPHRLAPLPCDVRVNPTLDVFCLEYPATFRRRAPFD